jgi:hypothetical protein
MPMTPPPTISVSHLSGACIGHSFAKGRDATPSATSRHALTRGALYQREWSSGSCPTGSRFLLATRTRLSQNERSAIASGGHSVKTSTTSRCRAALTVAAIAALAGCAPDALNNRAATGFNAYLDQIAVACKPLTIGRYDMTYRLTNKGVYGDDFDYFFDLTSKLYYQRTSPEAYRSGINGFFGAGVTTNRSIDCILANLPTDRPVAAPPLGGVIKVN